MSWAVTLTSDQASALRYALAEKSVDDRAGRHRTIEVGSNPQRLYTFHSTDCFHLSVMLTSLRAAFSQQRVLALGGAVGAGAVASAWLVCLRQSVIIVTDEP